MSAGRHCLESDARLRQIAAAIELYLALHPEAADISAGIAQWWLPAVGISGEVDEVERALLMLEARGTVECLFLGDRRCLWRIRAKHAAQPETLKD